MKLKRYDLTSPTWCGGKLSADADESPDGEWVKWDDVAALVEGSDAQGEQQVECGTCHGSGWVVRDPDIGTEQECFSCGGSGVDEEANEAQGEQKPAAWLHTLADGACFGDGWNKQALLLDREAQAEQAAHGGTIEALFRRVQPPADEKLREALLALRNGTLLDAAGNRDDNGLIDFNCEQNPRCAIAGWIKLIDNALAALPQPAADDKLRAAPLTPEAVAEMMRGPLLTDIGYQALLNGDTIDARLDTFVRFAAMLAKPDAALAALPPSQSAWQPIETAPKGGGAESVTDPAWVEPPHVLLLFDRGQIAVGRWDWYYVEGGNGYTAGACAWVEPTSSELLALHYGPPTHWQPLPPAPEMKP